MKDVEKYSLMYEKSLEDSEVIKNRIDNINEKLDKVKGNKGKSNVIKKISRIRRHSIRKYDFNKKNRAFASINHDNLHGVYRESYDVTRELLLLQLERARKFIDEKTTHINLFEYLKKRIELNKTASVTEK